MPPVEPLIVAAIRQHQAGDLAPAEEIYRQILQTDPRHADALFLLGMLLHQTGRHADAIGKLRRALDLPSARPEARSTLLAAFTALGRNQEAIEAARKIVETDPRNLDAHHALAQLLLREGDITASLAHARRAAELAPCSPIVLRTLANTLVALDRKHEALVALERALQVKPPLIEALLDKASLHSSLNQIEEALATYTTALDRAPTNFIALNNLGLCHLQMSRQGEALRCFEAAVRTNPHQSQGWNNLGAVLRDLGRVDDAIAAFDQAVKCDPCAAEVHNNLGNSLTLIGRHTEAITAYHRSLEIRPDWPSGISNLLLTLLHAPDTDSDRVHQEHVRYDRRIAQPLSAQQRPHLNDFTPGRRLRIGYVSPDFREHPVRSFIEPILSAHEHDQVEVCCYSIGSRQDATTARLRANADVWRDAAAMDNTALAEQIRADRIDILIDLAGHTSENRLPFFARKPAPLQVTYLGYPATTGLAAMDYRLSDNIADPLDTTERYSERLVRLPDAFFVYDGERLDSEMPAAASPADTNGYMTFGSFNKFAKINDATLQAWAAILSAVPRSRLLFKADVLGNPSTRTHIIEFFTSHGVAEDRLDLRPWVNFREHLAMLESVDLALDTFPYNGHTTTCQALYMGTPTITRIGATFRSRVGASTLHQLDLADLVAKDWTDYVHIATSLADDFTRLRELRRSLRERMRQSPLMDASNFTRSLEAAFRSMWVERCAAH